MGAPGANGTDELIALRLAAQGLGGPGFAGAVEAVRRLGAVQAQDYPGSRWALGMRVPGLVEAEVDRLVDEGAILRTHILRPTWHLVLPEDFDWMRELTAPRIRSGLGARHRDLELDADTIVRALSAFERTLGDGRHRTRPELVAALEASGIPADVHRASHLILLAELEGLVISGRRRGRQHTYRLHHRAAGGRSRAEAVAELALRYFTSHGPAQLRDFAWWSGLNLGDGRAGVAAAGSALVRLTVNGVEHWLGAGARPAPEASAAVHLLPNFDEYTVAYRDREALLEPGLVLDMAAFSFQSILSNAVTAGGRVRGAWRRTVARGTTRIHARLAAPLGPAGLRGLEAAAARMAAFSGRPAALEVG